MFKVYKYELKTEIELPKGSEVLYVQTKMDGNFIYALVPHGVTEVEKHYFAVAPTGTLIDLNIIKCIGCIIEANYFIYHVFEVESPKVSGGAKWTKQSVISQS